MSRWSAASRPRKVLADVIGGRDNNFNLIRFIAASAVLFSHSFPLATGDHDSEPLRWLGVTPGSLAVDAFFIASGFLVTGSLFARPSLLRFAAARALRIYPALVAAVLLTVLVVGLHFTALSPEAFFTASGTWRYLARTATLLSGVEHVLPGAFEHNPWPLAANASLWTLPYEVAMYVTLALLAVALSAHAGGGERRMRVAAVLIFVLALVVPLLALALTHNQAFASAAMFVPAFAPAVAKSSVLHLAAMFFAGSALFGFRRRVPLDARLFWLLAAALGLAAVTPWTFRLVSTLALPYMLLFLAYVPGGFVRAFNRLGDYSYGMYIYAWPVQQITAASIKGVTPAQMMLVSFACTLCLAVASWHLIEKRALALAKRDRREFTGKPMARPT